MCLHQPKPAKILPPAVIPAPPTPIIPVDKPEQLSPILGSTQRKKNAVGLSDLRTDLTIPVSGGVGLNVPT